MKRTWSGINHFFFQSQRRKTSARGFRGAGNMLKNQAPPPPPGRIPLKFGGGGGGGSLEFAILKDSKGF